jgi:hypothetical protein
MIPTAFMHTQRHITFGVATYRSQVVLETNFLASPCLNGLGCHEILVQKNFMSAAKAYNEVLEQAANDMVVLVHHDVVLPALWLAQLEQALAYLEVEDPNWGVLGCYGATQDGKGWGHVYSFGLLGSPLDRPVPVQTLDEIVLILRKSSGLRFTSELPHFHFYGTDICLAAAEKGMKSYVIPCFCIHNAQQQLVLPAEFYEGYHFVRRRWKTHLPVQTPCVRVTQSNVSLYLRRMREAYIRYISKKNPTPRLANVRHLLDRFNGVSS